MTSEGQQAGQQPGVSSGSGADQFGTDGFPPDAPPHAFPPHAFPLESDGHATTGRGPAYPLAQESFPSAYAPPPQATPNGGSPFVVPAVPPAGQPPATPGSAMPGSPAPAAQPPSFPHTGAAQPGAAQPGYPPGGFPPPVAQQPGSQRPSSPPPVFPPPTFQSPGSPGESQFSTSQAPGYPQAAGSSAAGLQPGAPTPGPALGPGAAKFASASSGSARVPGLDAQHPPAASPDHAGAFAAAQSPQSAWAPPPSAQPAGTAEENPFARPVEPHPYRSGGGEQLPQRSPGVAGGPLDGPVGDFNGFTPVRQQVESGPGPDMPRRPTASPFDRQEPAGQPPFGGASGPAERSPYAPAPREPVGGFSAGETFGSERADGEQPGDRPAGLSAFGDQRVRVPGATLTGLEEGPPPGWESGASPARSGGQNGGSPAPAESGFPIRGGSGNGSFPIRGARGDSFARDSAENGAYSARSAAENGVYTPRGDVDGGADSAGAFPARLAADNGASPQHGAAPPRGDAARDVDSDGYPGGERADSNPFRDGTFQPGGPGGGFPEPGSGYPQRVPGTPFDSPVIAEPRGAAVPQPRDPVEHSGSGEPAERPGAAKGTARPVSASASVPVASRVAPPADAEEVPPPPAVNPPSRVYGRPAPVDEPASASPFQDENQPVSGAFGAAPNSGPRGAAPASGAYGQAPEQPYARPVDGTYGTVPQADGTYTRPPSGAPQFGGGSGDRYAPPPFDEHGGPAAEQRFPQPGSVLSDGPHAGGFGQTAPSGAPDPAPTSGAFGAASASGGFGEAPASAGFGTAPPAAGFGAAPTSGGFGAAPTSGGFGEAPTSGGFGEAPASGGFGTAPSSGGGQVPGRVAGRATASARVTPPPPGQPFTPESPAPGQPSDGRNAAQFTEFTTDIAGRGRPGQLGQPSGPPARTAPDHYSENTTDVSGRGQGPETYVPESALPSMHAAPPLAHGFPPAPDATQPFGDRPQMGGVFPGPANRATVTPPGPEQTAAWPGRPEAVAGQGKFDSFKQDAPGTVSTEVAKPDTPHVRMLPVILGVILGAGLIVGLTLGVTWLIARGSTDGGGGSNFSVSAGDCVKRNGNEAVTANCSDAGSFEVTAIVNTKEQCPDPNQPYVVNPTDNGRTQVLCLKPRG